MAAAVGRGPFEVLVDFLGGLDAEAQRPSVAPEPASAGIRVERIFGVEQLAELGRTHPRALAFGFLVAGVVDEDVAVGLEAFRAKLEQGHCGANHALLVIACPASVEIAVLFDKLERVEHPVAALGLDHIRVGDEQDRLFPRWLGSRPAGEKGVGVLALVALVREDLDVIGGPAVGPILLGEPVGHPLVLAASRDGRDLDRRLKQRPRLRLPLGRQPGRLSYGVSRQRGGRAA